MSLCEGEVEATTCHPADLPEGVPALRAFYLYMTSGCNLRCRHCWIVPRYVNERPDPGECIDPELLFGAVREAKPLGLCSAKITGGEPLLHPQFRAIVQMLSDEGLSLNMETNGTLMTPDMARWLKEETKVGFVSVSLDGASAQSHDNFRGVPGSFEAALRGLDFLVDAGYRNAQVIMSVYCGNIQEIDGIIDLAKAHGARSLKLSPISKTGRGKALHEQGLALSIEEHLELSLRIHEDLGKSAGLRLVMNTPPALRTFGRLWQSKGRTGSCGVRSILGILGGGEIAMCGIGETIPELVYGRLGEDSIRKIWLTNPTLLRLRRELDDISGFPIICGECVHSRSCQTGCVAQNYANSSRLVWPSPLCVEAEELGYFPAQRRKIPK